MKQNFAARVVDNTHFSFTYVETGIYSDDNVEIVSGLSEGEQVSVAMAKKTTTDNNNNQRRQGGPPPRF